MKYFWFLLLISFPIAAQDNSLLSPENRLKFGDYLYYSKDYIRTISEYEAVNKFNDTILLKIADSFNNLQEYDSSIVFYNKINKNSSFHHYAYLNILKNNLQKKDYKEFQGAFIKDEKDSTLMKMYFLSALVYSDEAMNNINVNYYNGEIKYQILGMIDHYKNPEIKSPLLAGILSTIIPGAGKIYTGEVGDGITSLLSTSAFAYLSISNFNKHHNVNGIIFGAIAGGFYAGNIYGSVISAKLINAKVDLNFKNIGISILNLNNFFIQKIEL